MGRTGSGVEVRANSIRITARHKGYDPIKRTLTRGGVALKPTKANIAYAERLVLTIRAAMRAGTYRAADYFDEDAKTAIDTVSAAIDRWLKVSGAKKESTQRAFAGIGRFWSTKLGAVQLSKLTKSQILIALQETGASGKTKNNKLSVLRQALKLAVDDGLLETDPSERIEAFAHQSEQVEVFTPAERDRLLAYFRERYGVEVWAWFTHQFWSGLRTGEGLALEWADVDFKSGTIRINKTLTDAKIVRTTKTSKARTVHMNEQSRAALQAMRPISELAGGRVFYDPRYAKPWHSDQQPRCEFWEPALKHLKMAPRSPYSTRHTYASVLLTAGVKPAFGAAQLGNNVLIFCKTYATWMGGESDAHEMQKLKPATMRASKTLV
jgi:integrase